MRRQELKSLIIGMVLGDGHLGRHFRRGIYLGDYYFDCAHSLKQYEYLVYKRDLLQNLFQYPIEIKTKDVYSKKTGKTYPVCYFRTRIHPRLTQIAKLLYNGHKKIIAKNVLDMLTPHAIALWYMDDGCMPKRKNYAQIWLHTNNFTLEENKIIRDWFKEKYDIEFNIKRCRQMYFLGRGMSEGHKFLELVKPYVLDCLKYKIDWQIGKNGFYKLSSQTTYNTAPAAQEGDDIVHTLGN